jgi:hypothetical protein
MVSTYEKIEVQDKAGGDKTKLVALLNGRRQKMMETRLLHGGRVRHPLLLVDNIKVETAGYRIVMKCSPLL